MGVRDVRRERAVRRICEGATATVVGGLILWSLTSSMSQPAPATERTAITATPAIEPSAAPNSSYSPSLAPSATNEAPVPRMSTNLSIPASISGPTVATPPPNKNLLPYSIPVGSVLLYENFSRYREGNATDWGPNTFVKTGLDRRHWLVSSVDGTHPVGYKIRLPNEFFFECRYSAYLPEVTRGVLGWWKDPVATRISFLNDQGIKYSIEWVIRFGNDPMRLNPLGSSSLYARKHYHTIKLPDGTASEVGVVPPTGLLRIDCDKNVVRVFVDGQPAGVGSVGPMGQLVGFEIDVVKAANGTLFFTDFKVAR